MRLRRADRCARCEREFTAGDEALWYREVELVTCVDCPVPQARAELDEAESPGRCRGAGRDRGCERSARVRSPPPETRRPRAQATRLPGCRSRAVDRRTAERARGQKGAKGEAFTSKRLEKHLAGTRVELLHDRRIHGHGKANLDHIAVGPGGVTVIDTKNYQGKVRVERVGRLF